MSRYARNPSGASGAPTSIVRVVCRSRRGSPDTGSATASRAIRRRHGDRILAAVLAGALPLPTPATDAHAQSRIGRLFSSPEQRVELDRLRDDSGSGEAPESIPVPDHAGRVPRPEPRTWLAAVRRDVQRHRHARRRSPGDMGQRRRDRRGRVDTGGSPRRYRRGTGRATPHPGVARRDERRSCAGAIRRRERGRARRVRASIRRGRGGDARRGRNAFGSRSAGRRRPRRTTATGLTTDSPEPRAGTSAGDADAFRSARRGWAGCTRVDGWTADGSRDDRTRIRNVVTGIAARRQ